MAWAKFFSQISRFACSSLVRQCTKRARRKFNKVGIIVRALLIPTRDGVHEAMAVLVQPAQFWWKSVELKSGVVYQLSGSLCTFWCNNDSGKRAGRFGELAAVYGSWVCTVQFAVCMVCLLGTERFTLPCNRHRGGYTHMDSIQRTQVNRTTQRANDASLCCL